MVNMTPEEVYFKCLNKNKRILELEEIITTDPEYSYLYARYVIKGPFQLGEEVIASNIYYSYWYSNDVLKGQFSLGEKIISNDPGTSFHYAKFVIKKPFYLGHFTIFNSSFKDDYINFLKSINYDMTQISEWML